MEHPLARPPLRAPRNAILLPASPVTQSGIADCWPRGDLRPPLRIAFYSHDTVGLGHIRRNLLIAQAVAQPPLEATTLVLAGAREAGVLPLAPGVDCVTMPSIQKTDAGEYRPRRLDVTLTDIVRVRARIAQAAIEAFRPDVFVVDTEPRGAFRELDAVLRALRARGHTHVVLGLRDIRDHPVVTRREWQMAANNAAIRDYYDEVWVYGEAAVFDVVREYGLPPEIAAKLRYTGYLDQRLRLDLVRPGDDGPRVLASLPPGRMMLCLLGGGQDGARLAQAFIDAPLPPDAFGVVLTGPQMPEEVREELSDRAALAVAKRVLRFLPEPAPLIASADRLVTMGGYNTTLEALSFAKPALIVPRVRPREEQLIRAERLRARALVDVLHPRELSPAALGAWLASDSRPAPSREGVDLGGLARLVRFLTDRVLAREAV